MIIQKTTINGSDFTNANQLNVSKSISDNNTVSNFTANYDSPYGRHKNSFTVGNEIKIYADNNAIVTNGSPDGQWKFNEGIGGIAYDTMGINNGSITGATYIVGKVGSALSFNGIANKVVVPSNGSIISNKSGLTWMMWINPKAISTGRNNLLWADADSGIFYTDLTDRKLYTYMSNYAGNTNYFASTGSLNYYNWNHIAMTFDGTTSTNNVKVYINGNLDVTKNLAAGSTKVTSSFNLGIDYPGGPGNFPYSGLMDDVRIYDIALSQNQINEIYNNGSGTELISNDGQNIFTGVIENVTFLGEGLNEKVELRGRDYSIRLTDNNVQPVVYTNMEIGSIVNDILKNNLDDIGSSFVQHPGIVLKRIAFKQPPINDALKQLADLSDYSYYVDASKNLHFEPTGSTFTGITLSSGNIAKMQFDKTREGMANQVWVYGDRQLVAAPTFKYGVGSPSGTTIGMGSVITLPDKPSNTQVSILGSIRIGGVYQMQQFPTSGTVYLVSYEDRQIIFPSGTEYGYYLPGSGGSVIVNYDKSVPIAKYGEDPTSKAIYGKKSLIINDKSIKDPNTATSLVNYYVGLANPLNNIECDLKGWFTFQPGQTVNVIMPNFNLNSTMPIIEQTYNFTPENMLEEKVIKVNLDNRQIDITDQIRDLSQRLDAIEAQDKQETDVITRIMSVNGGNALIVGSYWVVKTRNFIGSEFRVWDTGNNPPGISGTNATLRVGLLASGNIADASWIGSLSYLASGNIGITAFSTVRSGGYY